MPAIGTIRSIVRLVGATIIAGALTGCPGPGAVGPMVSPDAPPPPGAARIVVYRPGSPELNTIDAWIDINGRPGCTVWNDDAYVDDVPPGEVTITTTPHTVAFRSATFEAAANRTYFVRITGVETISAATSHFDVTVLDGKPPAGDFHAAAVPLCTIK